MGFHVSRGVAERTNKWKIRYEETFILYVKKLAIIGIFFN